MRRRFFVDHFDEQHAVMTGADAHHLARVLRAQSGQLYELSDGADVWLARVARVGAERVEFALLEPVPQALPALQTTLLLAVVKFDAFEWALEKATELGVHRLVPLAAARSDKALLGAAWKRSERWKKILREASQQARRVRMPTLDSLSKPEAAFASSVGHACFLLSESIGARPFRESLSNLRVDSATLAVGPEGGWVDSEFAAARSAGFSEVSLGKLILRTETAVVASLAALNFALSTD